jgi:G3E family GTPase
VAMADVLVLSKTDLVTPAQAARFHARLAAIAPGARIVTASRGAVAVTELFGHGAPDMNGALPEAEAWVNTPAYALSSLPLPPLAKPQPPLATGPSHGLFGLAPVPGGAWLGGGLMTAIAPAARHDDRISSVSMVFDDPIHPIMLDIWVETLIATRGPDILRLKAVIWADGFDTPFVIHGVQHIIDPPIRLARWTGDDRKSRVVIIGRDLPREALLESLEVLRTRPMVQD